MHKRVWFILSATAVVIVAILLVLHARHQTPQVDAAPGPPSAEVAVVRPGSIDQVLTLAGEFQPYQVVEIHPKVSGFIKHIYVDIGDKVHQGETLAVLEVPELDAQLQGTVSQLARSRADVTRARQMVAQAESMHTALHEEYTRLRRAAAAEPGLIAEQELDDAQAKDLASSARIDAAKAALSAAEESADVAQANHQRVSDLYSYTHVIAPLTGVITWRYADTGALIQSGTNSNSQALPIVRLAQVDVLRLRVPVPEDDVRYVHIGDPMQVRVDAVNQSFTGKVVRFTRSISATTRTMETEIDVKNPNLTLDPGMYANTVLQLANVSNVPAVPQGALVLNGSREQVDVLDSHNIVHIRTVKIGLQGSVLVQILSGLHPGDRVIVGGLSQYHEGEKVTPVLTTEPTSDVDRAQGSMVDFDDQQGGAQ